MFSTKIAIWKKRCCGIHSSENLLVPIVFEQVHDPHIIALNIFYSSRQIYATLNICNKLAVCNKLIVDVH